MNHPRHWGREPYLILIGAKGELPSPKTPLANWLGKKIPLAQTHFTVGPLDILIFHQAPLLEDPGQNVHMLFSGRFYTPDRPGTNSELLNLGLARGNTLAAALNGSFSLLFADHRSETVTMATDRINSRKVFHQKIGNLHFLASSIWLLPLWKPALNEKTLASMLANGAPLDTDTLINGVKLLERASIYTFKPDRLTRSRYLHFDLDNAYENEDPRELKIELKNLIIQAVRKRIPQNSSLTLSLSGGYDATAILAALRYQLKVDKVKCFSYGHPPHKHGCDERVAARLAMKAGYEHKILPSFTGDLGRIFEMSALSGQGITRFCNEPTVFEDLAQNGFGGGSVILVGDECMGWNDGKLTTDRHVLSSLPICGLETLNWMRRRMEGEVFDHLQNLLEQRKAELIRESSSLINTHDRKDFLYLKQRLPHVILPWRQFFIEPYLPVDHPLLDHEILEFISHVPTDLRRGKKLFKRAAKSLAPSLFLGPRASSGTTLNYWPEALTSAQGKEAIEVLNQKSRGTLLDQYLDEDLPLELYRLTLKAYDNAKKQFGNSLKTRLKKWDLAPVRKYRSLKSPKPRPVGPRVLLKRVLMLRLFLNNLERENTI
jgi:hypothetical protein